MKTLLTFVLVFSAASCFSQSSDNISAKPSMKFTLGGGFSLANSFKRGNADEFYSRISPDPSYKLDDGASGFKYLSMGFQGANEGKALIGMELQLVLTHASRAIWGQDTDLGYATEVYFSAKFVNLAIKLGMPIGSGYFIIEPGLDMGLMNGKIGMYNSAASWTIETHEKGALGVGGHAAMGLDIPLGKSLSLTMRAGYRALKVEETHEDDSSSTGFSSYYVNGVDGETVKVDWSGMYANVGILLLIGK